MNGTITLRGIIAATLAVIGFILLICEPSQSIDGAAFLEWAVMVKGIALVCIAAAAKMVGAWNK